MAGFLINSYKEAGSVSLPASSVPPDLPRGFFDPGSVQISLDQWIDRSRAGSKGR